MSRRKDLEVYYTHKLKSDGPRAFLEQLCDNILLGDDKETQIEAQIRVAVLEGRATLLENYTDKRGDTLLHKLAQFHKNYMLMADLVSACPSLLNKPRTGEFNGQTVLHIVISKGNLEAARTILTTASVKGDDKIQELFHARATGSRFSNTVLMGQLPLSVAALTLDLDMVKLLLDEGAPLHAQNSLGDTVLHSLVRFASIHSDHREAVVQMLQSLHATLPPRPSRRTSKLKKYDASKRDPLAVWLFENDAEQTPLTLAAALGEGEIFAAILALDGVYTQLDEHDGVFDIHLCDITEIDTVAQQRWSQMGEILNTSANKRVKHGKVEPTTDIIVTPKTPSAIRLENDDETTPTPNSFGGCCSYLTGMTRPRRKAVLEIVCTINVNKAFGIIKVDVVRDTIKAKWKAYRFYFYLWMLLHVLLMILLTAYAVYKTQVINDDIYGSTQYSATSHVTHPPGATPMSQDFVNVTSWLALCIGMVYLSLEAVRSLYMCQEWHLNLIHHNGLYRLVLVLFSLCIIADTIWFMVDSDNNFFLIIALLLGWYFVTFGLRVHKKFSFFTVMFQKVLLGDMLRFSIVILIQLLSFSVAIYVTFLNTNPVPEGFDNLGTTVMTMFKLMLGLTDIEILYEARHPWLAVALFILFVLITYVLLINSLIAMMSQTCALVSEDRNSQWELQTLSVVLLLESMMPLRWRHSQGKAKFVRRFDIKKGRRIQEQRFFRSVTSLQTQYTDGQAIVDRNMLMRTSGFGEHSMRFASHMETYNRTASPTPRTPSLARHRFQRLNKVLKWNGLLKQRESPQMSIDPFDFKILQKRLNAVDSKLTLLATIKDNKEEEEYSSAEHKLKDFDKLLSPLLGRREEGRRRHSSEQKSRKIQTDNVAPQPLSKSLPDEELHKLKDQSQQTNRPVSQESNRPVIQVYTVPDNNSGITMNNGQPVHVFNGPGPVIHNEQIYQTMNGHMVSSRDRHHSGSQPDMNSDHSVYLQQHNTQPLLMQNSYPLHTQNNSPYANGATQQGYILTNGHQSGITNNGHLSFPMQFGPSRYGGPMASTYGHQYQSVPASNRPPMFMTTSALEQQFLAPPRSRVRTSSEGTMYDDYILDNSYLPRQSPRQVQFRHLDINDVNSEA